MVQIFFVGATGHIGGAVLHQLVQAHPSASVTALVRDDAKAARLVARYPAVATVTGDTLDLALLEQHAREADVVVNTSPDITHDAGIRALLAGLRSRDGVRPYYIHTSGASLIWDEPAGAPDARWWDDVADVADILAFKGEAHTHAVTDKIVRDAAADVNVAIVSPGFVGGISPSEEHPTPITTPAIFLTARALKSGWCIARGENTHAWIHVEDLARMYLILIGKAIDGGPSGGDADEPFELWGPEAYYFGTGEDISFARFMGALAPVLREAGVVESTEVRSVSVVEAARASMGGSDYDPDATPPPPDTWAMHIAIMYGINMRVGASRMARLGWRAERGSVVETFPEVVAEFLKREKMAGGA